MAFSILPITWVTVLFLARSPAAFPRSESLFQLQIQQPMDENRHFVYLLP